jgi:hypothetical protein
MNNQLLYRWIPLLILVLFIVTGITLKHRNNKLAIVNNTLVLQNDSILSVNLQLTKEVSKLQRLLDSFSIKNSAARLGN